MLGDIRDERARAKRTVIGVNIGIELDCRAATAALRDGRGLGLNIAELVRDGASEIELLNRRAVNVDMIFVIAILASKAFPTRLIPQVCAALGAGKMISLGSRRGHLSVFTNPGGDHSPCCDCGSWAMRDALGVHRGQSNAV